LNNLLVAGIIGGGCIVFGGGPLVDVDVVVVLVTVAIFFSLLIFLSIFDLSSPY
jgi:hypothetical protein